MIRRALYRQRRRRGRPKNWVNILEMIYIPNSLYLGCLSSNLHGVHSNWVPGMRTKLAKLDVLYSVEAGTPHPLHSGRFVRNHALIRFRICCRLKAFGLLPDNCGWSRGSGEWDRRGMWLRSFNHKYGSPDTWYRGLHVKLRLMNAINDFGWAKCEKISKRISSGNNETRSEKRGILVTEICKPLSGYFISFDQNDCSGYRISYRHCLVTAPCCLGNRISSGDDFNLGIDCIQQNRAVIVLSFFSDSS